jgi:hypothetical protein
MPRRMTDPWRGSGRRSFGCAAPEGREAVGILGVLIGSIRLGPEPVSVGVARRFVAYLLGAQWGQRAPKSWCC